MKENIWLVENNVFTEGNPETITQIVSDLGMKSYWYKYISFESRMVAEGFDQKVNAPIVVYGSINTARYVLRRTSFVPGVWCDLESLRCCSYYVHFSKYLLQQEYTMLPFGELLRRKDWIYTSFGRDNQVFIRPDDNTKSFNSGLVHCDKFECWHKEEQLFESKETCLAVVAPPQEINMEYRLVIADKKPISASSYKENFVKGAPTEVWEFAEEIANSGWEPHPVYVMDIAKTPQGLRLVEIGSFNCAGLYASDLQPIVEKISEIAYREWKDLMN